MSYQAGNLPKGKHCFFGREGGVSAGIYESLNTNTNSQDNAVCVRKNLEIVAGFFALRYSDMFTMKQGVSATVVQAEKPSQFAVVADGAVTTSPDILLCLKTADCAPVLLADYKHGVIGAAHAGWRGAYKGVVDNTVALMVQNGAVISNIAAAVGPCMQQDSFEVQDDMRQEVLQHDADAFPYFRPAEEGAFFDLSGYVECRLNRLGIHQVENCRVDTFPPENGYFSFRRNTKLGLIKQKFDYPTQYSCIKL